ncbi:MAG: pyrroline-5-carboxylate reductase [Clostridia bacterium]|nr:pyrroline-5-carboxylate reductase [Clostridia bacterium]
MTIGFLGAGNMASAIVRGLSETGSVGTDIFVYDVDESKAMALFEDCGSWVCESAEQLVEKADVLVICIKPQVFPVALPPLREALAASHPLVISIAAGKTLTEIASFVGGSLPIVRVMPNVAAKIGEAVTAYCGNEWVTAADYELVARLFESVGTVLPLPEAQFGIFSVLASCSPAYTFLYMDALSEAGVLGGIPKETALKIVGQAVLGAARLMQETGEHPRVLADSVCSPGGTTIEGVKALQQAGFESAVLGAAAASLEKDKKL